MDWIIAVRVVVSLVVVAGILWATGRYLTRSGRSGHRQKVLHLIDRQNVGAKASVVVVDAADVRLVLGVTEHGMNVLHTSDVPPTPELSGDEPGERDEGGKSFAQLLSAVKADPAATPGQARAHGSIFAASTWRQAAAAVRGKR